MTAETRVVVAGGGVAALEAVLALGELAPGAIELTLVAPDESFYYRPASTARPFSLHPRRALALTDVAEAAGARLVGDSVALVDDAEDRLVTHDGDVVEFDALLLAVGADWRPGLAAGLAWSRDERATSDWAQLLTDLAQGVVSTLGFVVPRRAGWPVDAYELALIASAAAVQSGREAVITVITAEAGPLDAFGPAVGQTVAAALARAGIELLTSVEVDGTRQSEGVAADLSTGRRMVFDRLVSVPVAAGRAIGGVAHDAYGQAIVEPDGRVRGSERVWAAGDATSLVVKHALLAVGQAGAAAEAIAASIGVGGTPTRYRPRLRGIIVDPSHWLDQPVWVHPDEPLTHCLWWPPGRVTGPRLAPFIAQRDKALHLDFAWHPAGLPVDVPVAMEPGSDAEPGRDGLSDDPRAISLDAADRQLLTLKRTQRRAWAEEHRLERRLEDFERRERTVVEELERAGFLHGR